MHISMAIIYYLCLNHPFTELSDICSLENPVLWYLIKFYSLLKWMHFQPFPGILSVFTQGHIFQKSKRKPLMIRQTQ